MATAAVNTIINTDTTAATATTTAATATSEPAVATRPSTDRRPGDSRQGKRCVPSALARQGRRNIRNVVIPGKRQRRYHDSFHTLPLPRPSIHTYSIYTNGGTHSGTHSGTHTHTRIHSRVHSDPTTLKTTAASATFKHATAAHDRPTTSTPRQVPFGARTYRYRDPSRTHANVGLDFMISRMPSAPSLPMYVPKKSRRVNDRFAVRPRTTDSRADPS